MAAEPAHVFVAEARFYPDIADALAAGALAALEAGGASYERADVAGAFELPAAIAWADLSGRFDGFLALGCVIRGETSHYDLVCNETARALMELTTARGLALGFGLLTVENEDQAWARAKASQGDKGGEAARACLAMIALRRRLGVGER